MEMRESEDNLDFKIPGGRAADDLVVLDLDLRVVYTAII